MSNTKKELSAMKPEERIALRDKTASKLNDYIENTLHKTGFSEKRIKANVGGGIQVGDTFTLTGEVCVAEIADSQNVFLAVLTETGEKISIKSLIPQSVSGYTDKSAIDELAPIEDGEDVTAHEADEHYREIEATFDKKVAGGTASEVINANKEVLNHGTRNDIELYGLISEKLFNCKGFKLTYCGKVVHQIKATKNYTLGEVEVQKGARRAMTISVWKITKPSK